VNNSLSRGAGRELLEYTYTGTQLYLHESQIYGWLKNSKKDTNTGKKEQGLTAKVAKAE
tara:strand:- start:20748 stop:20924 length:177 start_codon:yes stop_codon:yes gene_type:complete